MGAAGPAMAAMQVVGGIIGRDQAYRGSRVDEENARLSLLDGEREALDVRKDARQQTGAALTGMAGSGLLLSGSATDLLAESEYQAELDVLNTRRQAYGQARNYKQQAKDRRQAGDNALIGGIFSAVGTVLGDASQKRRDRLRAENADSFGG